ncbi:hypothetical protein RBU49_02520 [Clostridium sp. MB40-C1]|uniref:hypothetical protein n=1 Tax=Clostridium sp. MB40-C1 TaxID=3070996 RepID=UPI0027DF767F|nr:hypothetical protein [Clostridium sp. MB40-C1]WMJ81144.1 hypothetical protein RBU49_02520 [Clostridium sp. MB40-C1]
MGKRTRLKTGVITLCMTVIVIGSIGKNYYKKKMNEDLKEPLKEICLETMRNTEIRDGQFRINMPRAIPYSEEKLKKFFDKNKDKYKDIFGREIFEYDRCLFFVYNDDKEIYLQCFLNLRGKAKYCLGKTYEVRTETYKWRDNIKTFELDKKMAEEIKKKSDVKNLKEKDIVRMPGNTCAIVREKQGDKIILEMLKWDYSKMINYFK